MIRSILLIVLAFPFSQNIQSQVTIQDFDDARIYFDGLFDENSTLDDYGNIVIDLGSASAGRYSFRITDVDITMEERPEEPGCADVCPERILLTLSCSKSECIEDPGIDSGLKTESAVIVFYDLGKGKKAFKIFNSLKAFFKNN